MKLLSFHYHLKISFDTPVRNHNFTLRWTPGSDARQHILQLQNYVSAHEFLSEGADQWGNILLYGRCRDAHSCFETNVCGRAAVGLDTSVPALPGDGIFRFETALTHADAALSDFGARRVIGDIAGADVVFDIHASNIFLTEVPQIRINERHRQSLVPLAQQANVDFIWVHGASTVLESTFAYSLNALGTPCLVVEMGVGMRLTGEYGQQLTTGILNVMKHLGMWDGPVSPVRTPLLSEKPEAVEFLNAPCSGMFMKTRNHGTWVKKGETIGYIFDPYRGEVLEYVSASKSGLLFTIREYPLVDEGSLMGRILVREAEGRLVPGRQIMVIPSINPNSMNIGKRFWGIDNTDINRMFPGYDQGETTQRIGRVLIRK